MVAPLFNALAYVDKLTRSGIPDEQARAHADALEVAFQEGVATKEDLRALEARMDNRFDRVGEEIGTIKADITRLSGDVDGLKSDVAGLKSDVADLKVDVAGIRGEMRGFDRQFAGIRGEIAGLDGKMTGMRGELTAFRGEMQVNRWLMGSVIVGVLLTMLRTFQVI